MQATDELNRLVQDAFEAEARMRETRLQLFLFVERKPEAGISYLDRLPPEFERHCSLLKELRAATATKCCGEFLKLRSPTNKRMEQS